MGGIYFNIWSCSNCNYTSKSVMGPKRVEPKDGTPKAKIEDRWCDDCKSIQLTFTGKGASIDPGHEPDSPISKWEFRNVEDFEKAILKLEEKKKKSIFFFLSKDAKKLKNYYLSKALCKKYTEINLAFYNELKPKPKCLKCGGINVSKIPFYNDKHACGGEFIRKDSGRVGSVSQYEFIEYSADGTSTSQMKYFN